MGQPASASASVDASLAASVGITSLWTSSVLASLFASGPASAVDDDGEQESAARSAPQAARSETTEIKRSCMARAYQLAPANHRFPQRRSRLGTPNVRADPLGGTCARF